MRSTCCFSRCKRSARWEVPRVPPGRQDAAPRRQRGPERFSGGRRKRGRAGVSVRDHWPPAPPAGCSYSWVLLPGLASGPGVACQGVCGRRTLVSAFKLSTAPLIPPVTSACRHDCIPPLRRWTAAASLVERSYFCVGYRCPSASPAPGSFSLPSSLRSFCLSLHLEAAEHCGLDS